MASGGLWMLLVLGVLVLGTGLPVWALLVGLAWGAAMVGLFGGMFDAAVLSALSTRVINLLEHDLLQALPLYVFVGLLLQRVVVADSIFDLVARAARPLGAAPSLATLAVGSLISPMNGSVAASSALLGRLVSKRLLHLPAGRAHALVAVAATIGVVVPPSLVLMLLGDAMLRAHTEASNLPGYLLGTGRIVNTQDILRGALLPAGLLLLGWSVVAWWSGRGGDQATVPPALPGRRSLTAVLSVLLIVGLLAGVYLGLLYAIEAAATGAVLLVAGTLLSRALSAVQWRDLLLESLGLSGALFALLAGSTSFSLVFRLFGTDVWLTQAVTGSPLPPVATALLVLVVVAACAWVLDAFEMIFVIIPIVAPLLIVALGDAQQVAVLLLLVLQLSFIAPPIGYAVLMARARSGLPPASGDAISWGLLPFLLLQVCITAAVFLAPALVHTLDPAAAPASQPDRPSVGGRTDRADERNVRRITPKVAVTANAD